MITIACLADHRPYKGRQDLLDALALLKGKLNYRLTTNLCGADIFVLPSHTEGFSNALLEAMAMGLPCIATCVGGNLDAIEHNKSGLLVAPHHPLDLAHAILTLAHDHDQQHYLGAQARKRVEQHFTLNQCVNKYIELYNKVLQ